MKKMRKSVRIARTKKKMKMNLMILQMRIISTWTIGEIEGRMSEIQRREQSSKEWIHYMMEMIINENIKREGTSVTMRTKKSTRVKRKKKI